MSDDATSSPSPPTTNPLIARLRLLTGLSDDDLELLERACAAMRSSAAGTDIAPEGARPDGLHVVLDGWAARYKLLSDGRRQLPALLLPGDICDLDGLLLRRVHSGVCALTSCKVAMLPHTQIRALMDRRPAIREAFWWLASVENAVSAEWSVRLACRTADERMAHLLCELLLRLCTAGLSQTNGFALPMTQVDLADALGLSAVHVNRTLKGLRGRGVIALEDGWLTIRDYEALRTLAGFCADYLHVEGLHLATSTARH